MWSQCDISVECRGMSSRMVEKISRWKNMRLIIWMTWDFRYTYIIILHYRCLKSEKGFLIVTIMHRVSTKHHIHVALTTYANFKPYFLWQMTLHIWHTDMLLSNPSQLCAKIEQTQANMRRSHSRAHHQYYYYYHQRTQWSSWIYDINIMTFLYIFINLS